MTSAALLAGLLLQLPQNPSPMAETSRAHTRVERRPLATRKPSGKGLFIIHFHGAPWLIEQEAARIFPNAKITAIQIGAGSRVYSEAYKTKEAFEKLIVDAGTRPILLTSFSAGYGAIREILTHSPEKISGVLLIDGLHSDFDLKGLDSFAAFARRAKAKKAKMLVTHSEIFPGTYASTTQTADWLATETGLKRKAVLKWGPNGMQQIAEAKQGQLEIRSFAGNTGPDHTDHLHAYATWLRTFRHLRVTK